MISHSYSTEPVQYTNNWIYKERCLNDKGVKPSKHAKARKIRAIAKKKRKK